MYEASDRREPDAPGGKIDERTSENGTAVTTAALANVRCVLVAIGGGGVRIGRELARQRIRFFETVAINCDASVQGLEEFDHRICLAPGSLLDGGTAGSAQVAGTLARAARTTLERVYQNASFTVIVSSLGGGTGSGVFPFALELACTRSDFVSAFVVKPFACERERRAIAERVQAHLEFIGPDVDKHERGEAELRVLDNEAAQERNPRLPMSRLASHWAAEIREYIEQTYLIPLESTLRAMTARAVSSEPPLSAPPIVAPAVDPLWQPPVVPIEATPPMAPEAPLPAIAPAGGADVTFEVEGAAARPTPPN